MIHTLRRFTIGSMALAVVAIAPFATATSALAAGNDSSQGTEAVATLKVTSTKVEVKKDGAEKFKVAKDGATLREGDTVRTDETGLAEIDYDDESYTRLDVDTTFTIKKLTKEQGDRQVQGSLETGQTWSRTAALTESGSFEEEGAGANAVTRGTAFAVVCDTPDHCTFTAVVDAFDLESIGGVTKLLTPLDQCDSTSGALCGDITQISAEDLPDWIAQNLLQDLIEKGIDDSGFLAGTVVVQDGVVSFVPAGSVPGEPVVLPIVVATVPGAPTNVSAAGDGGSAIVAFSPPSSDGGSPITSYTVTGSPGTGGASVSATAVASASGSGSPIVVGGLTTGTPYTFSVSATNAIGTGPSSAPSNVVTPVAVPEAPTGVSAAGADGAATVSFAAPGSDGGSAITGYTVTGSPGGSCAAIAPALSCTVTGLVNGTAYTFTVTATNAVGTGPPSAPSNSVTPQPDDTVPGAPTGATAVAGNELADVSWSAPSSDGGSAITGYTVTGSPGGSCTAIAPTTSCTVTGLDNGTAYTFTVTATNAVGTGSPSGASNEVTPTGPPEFVEDGAICVGTPTCVASNSISVEDEHVAYFTANVTDPQGYGLVLRFSTLPTAGTICAKTDGAVVPLVTVTATVSCSGGYEFGALVTNAVAVSDTTTTFPVDTLFAYSPGPNDDDFNLDVTDSFTIEATNEADQSTSASVDVTVCENDPYDTCLAG